MQEQDERYFQRMHASLGDKAKILPHITGSRVLDVGSGTGSFLSLLVEQGYDAYGVDASSTSLHEAVKRYPHLKDKFLQSWAHEISDHFEEESLDTLIASSLLHEVYSYGLPDGNILSCDAVQATLKNWRDTLVPGGRIIIRDGIIPENWNEKVTLTFLEGSRYDLEGKDMFTEYMNSIPFRNVEKSPTYRNVLLEELDENHVTGSYESVMEFLYTYTWGYASYHRETQEKYGLHTLSNYVLMLEHAGFHVEHAQEYVQPGYVTRLKDKVVLSDASERNKSIPFPSTNALLVARKM